MCTSAPFCSKTSTTSLHPFFADMYKGVAPSWGIQHVQQMQIHKKQDGQKNKHCTISTSCSFLLQSRKQKHTIDSIKAYHVYLITCGNMLFQLAQHFNAQVSQKMPTACHVWQKWCSQQHSLVLNQAHMWFMFKVSNTTWYQTLRTHHKTFMCVHHPLCKAAPWGGALRTNIFWGEAQTLMCPQEKHAKLCTQSITFRPIFMDVQTEGIEPHQTWPTDHWLNALCHCQCHSHALHFISRTLTYVSLNQVSLFIRNYLSGGIYFSPIL